MLTYDDKHCSLYLKKKLFKKNRFFRDFGDVENSYANTKQKKLCKTKCQDFVSVVELDNWVILGIHHFGVVTTIY